MDRTRSVVRLLAALALAVVMLAALPAGGLAFTANATVNTATPLRSGPLSYASVIATLQPGERVQQVTSSGSYYYLYTNEGNGWALMSAIALDGATTPTPAPPTPTVAPTPTSPPPTSTPPPPTSTAVPPTPTSTPVPPTSTPLPPTATGVPATSTAAPTATGVATATRAATATPTKAATATSTAAATAAPTKTPTATPTAAPSGNTFYVSPTGADANPGTLAAPWKTFDKAARTLTAGQTAIFLDGTYNETVHTETVNAGTAAAPIVYEAQHTGAAHIVYQNLCSPNCANAYWGGKLRVTQPYVTVQGFDITQPTRGTGWGDLGIYCDGNVHPFFAGCVIRDNTAHNFYGNCFKAYKAPGALIEGNVCSGNTEEGIDLVYDDGAVVRNNTVQDVGEVAIFVKGGSHNVALYGNTVRLTSGTMQVGLSVGESTDSTSGYCSASGCYEAYGSVAYDNVVVSNAAGGIVDGIAITGATDSALVNNVVVGAQWCLLTQQTAGVANGWGWNPPANDATLENNVADGCTAGADGLFNTAGTLTYDYNLSFNSATGTAVNQPHGVVGDPKFVDPLNDWHLQAGSPAIGAGAALGTVDGVDVSTDRGGRSRTAPWDIGVYDT